METNEKLPLQNGGASPQGNGVLDEIYSGEDILQEEDGLAGEELETQYQPDGDGPIFAGW